MVHPLFPFAEVGLVAQVFWSLSPDKQSSVVFILFYRAYAKHGEKTSRMVSTYRRRTGDRRNQQSIYGMAQNNLAFMKTDASKMTEIMEIVNEMLQLFAKSPIQIEPSTTPAVQPPAPAPAPVPLFNTETEIPP